MVEEDVVIIYASIQGKDKKGFLRAISKAYEIKPMFVGKHKLRAIQTTTAAPLAEMARYLVTQNPKGIILQSQVNTDSFLNGPFVSAVYGSWAKSEETKSAFS